MDIFIHTLIAFGIACELVILFNAFKSGKPFKLLLCNALFGLAALLILNTTKKFTGISIELNAYTVTTSSAFGIPAVLGLVIGGFII